MSDLAVTAASVNVANPEDAIIKSYIAANSIVQGNAIYVGTAGKGDVASANVGGDEQFRGIALQSVGAGQAFEACEDGEVEGFDLSGLAYDALVFLSNTPGALATAAGTKTVQVGRVVPTTNKDSSGNIRKLLRVRADMIRNW